MARRQLLRSAWSRSNDALMLVIAKSAVCDTTVGSQIVKAGLARHTGEGLSGRQTTSCASVIQRLYHRNPRPIEVVTLA
jgi:hypothetical protein